MRRIVGIILSLALACGLLLGAGCVRSQSNQPTTITIWHVYGGQTDSPLNDLIDVFNNTVGVEEGIQVEVAMVSDNKNIHNGIIAAAAGEPGSPKLPDMFVSYPKTVLALPDQSILVDYRDYFTEDELAAFVPAFLEDGEVDGHLVCLPVAPSGFYRSRSGSRRESLPAAYLPYRSSSGSSSCNFPRLLRSPAGRRPWLPCRPCRWSVPDPTR